jgi:hypothetical protein
MPYCICCEQNRVNVARLTERAQPGMDGGTLLQLQKCLAQYVFNHSGKLLEIVGGYWDVPWDVCAYCFHDSSAYRFANWSMLKCL